LTLDDYSALSDAEKVARWAWLFKEAEQELKICESETVGAPRDRGRLFS
jgi:hypothetical protein